MNLSDIERVLIGSIPRRTLQVFACKEEQISKPFGVPLYRCPGIMFLIDVGAFDMEAFFDSYRKPAYKPELHCCPHAAEAIEKYLKGD